MASRPAITGLFLQFLRDEAAHAEALYVPRRPVRGLARRRCRRSVAVEVREALARLRAGGVPVFLMRGNRDFLFGPRLAAETGVRLLPDPCVVQLYGEPTLLMHGDLLCSDDRAYLAFRAQVRDPAWQQSFLAMPLAERAAFAARARAASSERQAGLVEQGELETITDASATTVEATMARYGVRRMIHGHNAPAGDPFAARKRRAGAAHRTGRLVRARLGAARQPEGYALTALE
jgi:UDP-2,3-diacylglucosamine hydrolase